MAQVLMVIFAPEVRAAAQAAFGRSTVFDGQAAQGLGVILSALPFP
ncbi:MAG: hypothetical protein HC875_36325 [Anaerolineales bacterium]|nr:hypothetical protein [Anaerolineales bacterium]